ncbi:alkaline phosphatase [Tautonia rosea]|uniref:alkaline phosphatase n=1 Tax=Tautonia rosea TaxID=2728037 RepID=UPI00147408BB|nr:alkaline phosphatase [Tautonia rosea]
MIRLLLPTSLLTLALMTSMPISGNPTEQETRAEPAPRARVDHLVIVGVDGLGPEGIRRAETPAIDAVIARGAWSMRARAVMPTSSSPNWASMIMGAGPEQHGVTSNAWEPDAFEIAPTVAGPDGRFPTIFSILREQRPEAEIAVIYDWGGFGRLLNGDEVDLDLDADGPEAATAAAEAALVDRRPTLLFVHLDHVDHALHDHGFLSEPYLDAVTQADRFIGRIVSALDRAGLTDRAAVLITSDHGGRGTSHGGATMDEMLIPWILSGPGIGCGVELADPINTYDTAATAAVLLGITPPECWIARPVTEALAATARVPGH